MRSNSGRWKKFRFVDRVVPALAEAEGPAIRPNYRVQRNSGVHSSRGVSAGASTGNSRRSIVNERHTVVCLTVSFLNISSQSARLAL